MIAFFSGGDFRHFYSENIGDFITLPLAWDSSLNTGTGHSQIGSLWIIAYFNFTLLFNKLGLSWNLISLFFWILPAIFLSFFSASLLFNHLFKDKIMYSLLSGIIYTFNTFFLMILTGGQLGVALSYSLVPLVLLMFIKTVGNPTLRNFILVGLALGVQIIFDPRIVYVALVAVFLYLLFNLSHLKAVKNKISLLTPFIIAVLLNSFWILPLVLTKSSPIPEGFNSVKGFEFFSFADFSHALSLLHPNWPENIFGKTYFLKPEFLLLPILAFSSLLFSKNKNILFFSFLALVGSFLAKGANPPFEQVNEFLFRYIPGMVMFRDPTKFYLLVVLSYSVLIPYSILNFSTWINSKFKIQNSKSRVAIQRVSVLIGIIFLLFLVRPLFIGELREKFKPQEVPKEYVELKNFLVSKPQFFRTLWIPEWQRFGYFSNNHPAIGREEILKGDARRQAKELKNKSTISLLKNLSVRYVIVPFDSQGEIFLKDRKYDEGEYQRTVQDLKNMRELKQVKNFGKNVVFELGGYKDHFWSPSTNLGINDNFLSPTNYTVDVQNAKKGDLLVFSEGFDKDWIAETVSGMKYYVSSSKYDGFLNSFVLPEGNYELKVFYNHQRWVNSGLSISGITVLAVLGLGLNRMRNK